MDSRKSSQSRWLSFLKFIFIFHPKGIIKVKTKMISVKTAIVLHCLSTPSGLIYSSSPPPEECYCELYLTDEETEPERVNKTPKAAGKARG